MIDGRFFSPGRFYGLPGSFYTTKIKVYRGELEDPGNPNAGLLGEPTASGNLSSIVVADGHPASILAKGTVLKMTEAGQTEVSQYLLTVPYKRLIDGTLVVQARDTVIDLADGSRYLVINSHDPMDTRSQIMVTLEHGPVG